MVDRSGYDNLDNILTFNNDAYVYDAADQLIEDADYTYTYDGNGNLLTKTITTVTTTYTYNSANQLTYDGTNIYTYDESGNLESNGIYTYIYDVKDRLIEVKQGPSTIAIYSYNASGQRLSKTVGGQDTQYIYNDSSLMVYAELSSTNKVFAGNTNAYSQLVYLKIDGKTYYYVYDAIGQIIGLTDTNGEWVVKYSYDSWGNPTEYDEDGIGQSLGTFSNPYLYKNYYYDTETGLYYLNARYYNPRTARFITRDPLPGVSTRRLSQNAYLYSANNPIAKMDPSGAAWRWNKPRDGSAPAHNISPCASPPVSNRLSYPVKVDGVEQSAHAHRNPRAERITDLSEFERSQELMYASMGMTEEDFSEMVMGFVGGAGGAGKAGPGLLRKTFSWLGRTKAGKSIAKWGRRGLSTLRRGSSKVLRGGKGRLSNLYRKVDDGLRSKGSAIIDKGLRSKNITISNIAMKISNIPVTMEDRLKIFGIGNKKHRKLMDSYLKSTAEKILGGPLPKGMKFRYRGAKITRYGFYRRSTRAISIFSNPSHKELIHTMGHEFGHDRFYQAAKEKGRWATIKLYYNVWRQKPGYSNEAQEMGADMVGNEWVKIAREKGILGDAERLGSLYQNWIDDFWNRFPF